MIDKSGIGCEPASACSLAGTTKLVRKGIIKPNETVVGILTGNILKDPDATIGYHNGSLQNIHSTYPNEILQAEDSIEDIITLIEHTI